MIRFLATLMASYVGIDMLVKVGTSILAFCIVASSGSQLAIMFLGTAQDMVAEEKLTVRVTTLTASILAVGGFVWWAANDRANTRQRIEALEKTTKLILKGIHGCPSCRDSMRDAADRSDGVDETSL